MFTTHRILAVTTLFCSLVSTASPGYFNSGSHQSEQTALFSPHVINTGSIATRSMDARSVLTFTNTGSLAVDHAQINNGARFTFEGVRAVEFATTTGTCKLRGARDMNCGTQFINSRTGYVNVRLSFNPETGLLKIGMAGPGDHIELAIPHHCTLRINAPLNAITREQSCTPTSLMHIDDSASRANDLPEVVVTPTAQPRLSQSTAHRVQTARQRARASHRFNPPRTSHRAQRSSNKKLYAGLALGTGALILGWLVYRSFTSIDKSYSQRKKKPAPLTTTQTRIPSFQMPSYQTLHEALQKHTHLNQLDSYSAITEEIGT